MISITPSPGRLEEARTLNCITAQRQQRQGAGGNKTETQPQQ
jgi:hypothetical protein